MPTKHKKAHKTTHFAPSDPLNVTPDPLDPLDAPLDPFGPLNIPWPSWTL